MLRSSSTTAGNGNEIVWATADDANRRWAVISGHIEGNTGSSASGGLVFGTKGTSDSALNNRLQIKAGSEAVFNEDSTNFDFRVESDSNAYMLHVDAGANKVSVGFGSPQAVFNVQHSLNNSSDWWTNTKGSAYLQNLTGHTVIKFNNETGWDSKIVYNSSTSTGFSLFDRTSLQTSFQVYSNAIVLNEDSADRDFRVESDGNANMLFVDAGENRVGVGTSAPVTTFHVAGAIRVEGAIDSGSVGTGYGAPGINATITGLPCYEGVVYQYIARANTSPTNVAIQTGYAMGRTGSTFTFQQTLSSSRIGVTSAANGDITITNTHSGSAALSIRVLRIL